MLRRLLPFLLFAVVVAACNSSGRTAVHAPLSPTASATQVVSAAAAASPSATAAVTATPVSVLGGAAAQPSGDRALHHVQVLAGDIGPRPAASPAEQKAGQYIAGQLRDAGYDVELQGFPIKTFISRSVEFRVLSPDPATLQAAPLTYSHAGTATSDLFFANLGRPSDYPAGGIGGRIALVQRGELTFGDKARNAAAAGASALVIFDPPNGVIPGTLSGDIPSIPVLTIPGEDGVRLRDLAAAQTVRVALSFDGGVEEGTATNVIGRPAGADCAAVVGSHYDTVPQAPGASDNGSGTAAMLELARVQAARGNPEHACFVAFSGEELGLLGSIYFVDHLTDAQRKAIKFMLNFDMVAVGDKWEFIGSPSLQQKAQGVASSMGIAGQASQLVGASSDHAAFIDRKIPALLLFRSDDPLLHTPQDTVDRITAAPLETAVRLGLAFLTSFGQG